MGTALGLDQLVAKYALDEEERIILLLAMVPAISREVADCYDHLSKYGFGGNNVSIEAIGTFLGLDLAGRIRLRSKFHQTSRLLQNELVTVDIGHECPPAALPGSVVEITGKSFDLITGTSDPKDGTDVADGVCPCCGRALDRGEDADR